MNNLEGSQYHIVFMSNIRYGQSDTTAGGREARGFVVFAVC